MNKPRIYAKSSLSHEQARVKMDIGCDGLEIQLLGELIEDRFSSKYKYCEQAFEIEDFIKYPIEIIHMPLVPGMGDVLLEALVDDNDVTLLVEVFRLAEYYAIKQNHNIGIVIHSESFYDKLVDEDVWNKLVDKVKWLLTNYPEVNLIIENVSPLRGIGKGKALHLANNFAFDNVEMVTNLRRDTGISRIYTCLDTCHAMLADKYISIMYDAVGDVPKEDLSLDRFFEENAEVIGLIHLSNINGSGYGKGRHGVPFDKDTYYKLKFILDLYYKYNYTCPITLEVEETDYSTCDGYRKTKELVESYFIK